MWLITVDALDHLDEVLLLGFSTEHLKKKKLPQFVLYSLEKSHNEKPTIKKIFCMGDLSILFIESFIY